VPLVETQGQASVNDPTAGKISASSHTTSTAAAAKHTHFAGTRETTLPTTFTLVVSLFYTFLPSSMYMRVSALALI
jgi:hypothetical protein